MSDMTPGEIARAFAQNARDHDKFVTEKFHDEQIDAIREDLSRLETTVNRLLWAIVTLAFTVIVQVLVDVRGAIP